MKLKQLLQFKINIQVVQVAKCQAIYPCWAKINSVVNKKNFLLKINLIRNTSRLFNKRILLLPITGYVTCKMIIVIILNEQGLNRVLPFRHEYFIYDSYYLNFKVSDQSRIVKSFIFIEFFSIWFIERSISCQLL